MTLETARYGHADRTEIRDARGRLIELRDHAGRLIYADRPNWRRARDERNGELVYADPTNEETT